jgi:hypothetical protein
LHVNQIVTESRLLNNLHKYSLKVDQFNQLDPLAPFLSLPPVLPPIEGPSAYPNVFPTEHRGLPIFENPRLGLGLSGSSSTASEATTCAQPASSPPSEMCFRLRALCCEGSTVVVSRTPQTGRPAMTGGRPSERFDHRCYHLHQPEGSSTPDSSAFPTVCLVLLASIANSLFNGRCAPRWGTSGTQFPCWS